MAYHDQLPTVYLNPYTTPQPNPAQKWGVLSLAVASVMAGAYCLVAAVSSPTVSNFAVAPIFNTRTAPQYAMSQAGAQAALRPSAFNAPLRPSMALAAEEKAEEKEKRDPGHSVKGMPQLTEEQMKQRQALQEHQQAAARLSFAEEARNMLAYGTGYGVISTNSQSEDGYPAGSIVGFAPDSEGHPVFAFSTMSSHTQDLLKDGRASLVVTTEDFKGAADGRVSLVGDITKVPKDQIEDMKAIYKQKHPDAFWVDFGDFLWYRMSAIKSIRFIGGFARAGSITPEDYAAAKPDPIAAFAKPVLTHMNDDHADANAAIVNHYVPIEGGVDAAEISGLDRLGMDVKVTKDGANFKLRVPFPREATDRKAIKDILVEMTKAGAKASAGKKEKAEAAASAKAE